MKNLSIYFDLETTGLNPYIDEIVQFSAIVEDQHENIIDEIDLKARPSDIGLFKAGVIELLHLDPKEVMARPLSQKDLYDQILQFFDKHINKYDRDSKFIPIGYNIDFDKSFLRQFFLKHDNRYIDSYLEHHSIDVMAFSHILLHYGKIPEGMNNSKLTTICELLNIPLEKAHDSLYDTHAMRRLLKWFEANMDINLPENLQ